MILCASLPSRERGLKYPRTGYLHDIEMVAPFTGAWIEIGHHRGDREGLSVAPFTGAWIEMLRLSQGPYHRIVAPFTGAWIEIGFPAVKERSTPSLPSRERGLKYYREQVIDRICWSLPSRERGLKYDGDKDYEGDMVSLPSRERGLK